MEWEGTVSEVLRLEGQRALLLPELRRAGQDSDALELRMLQILKDRPYAKPGLSFLQKIWLEILYDPIPLMATDMRRIQARKEHGSLTAQYARVEERQLEYIDNFLKAYPNFDPGYGRAVIGHGEVQTLCGELETLLSNVLKMDTWLEDTSRSLDLSSSTTDQMGALSRELARWKIMEANRFLGDVRKYSPPATLRQYAPPSADALAALTYLCPAVEGQKESIAGAREYLQRFGACIAEGRKNLSDVQEEQKRMIEKSRADILERIREGAF